jgi:hypothetical protein
MSFSGLNLKALAIICAVVAVAAVLVVLARPRPIESAVLGAEWQCSRTFVLTTCAQQASPGPEAPNKVALRAPRV